MVVWLFDFLSRFKVLGPDGSMYVLGQEVQVGGSDDADDAWMWFALPSYSVQFLTAIAF